MADEKKNTKKQYRKDTTEVHPLFDGNAAQYHSDEAHRANVAKAKADSGKKDGK
jgi:hypothetical protein